MSYNNRHKNKDNYIGREPVALDSSDKPVFPRREDFPSLERYRNAQNQYDLWVKNYLEGEYLHISKYPLKFKLSLAGTTYVNQSRTNRLPRKVRKKKRVRVRISPS